MTENVLKGCKEIRGAKPSQYKNETTDLSVVACLNNLCSKSALLLFYYFCTIAMC